MSADRPIPRPACPASFVSSHARPSNGDVEDLSPDEVVEVPESDPPPPTPLQELRSEMREGFTAIDKRITDESTLVRREFVQLRHDLGLVAARTLPQKVGSGVLKGSAGVLIVGGVVAVLNALAAKWPWLADVAKALGGISL